MSNPRYTKSPHDIITEKMSKENAEKYGSSGVEDYQNVAPQNWEMYITSKKRRYAQNANTDSSNPTKVKVKLKILHV